MSDYIEPNADRGRICQQAREELALKIADLVDEYLWCMGPEAEAHICEADLDPGAKEHWVDWDIDRITGTEVAGIVTAIELTASYESQVRPVSWTQSVSLPSVTAAHKWGMLQGAAPSTG